MLQKISIQNFKSLKNVTLELQKVNLLISPNNSGKSDFLKAFEKLKSIISDYSKSLDDASSSNLSFDEISVINSIIQKNDFFLKAKAKTITFDFTVANITENDNFYSALFEITDEFSVNTANVTSEIMVPHNAIC